MVLENFPPSIHSIIIFSILLQTVESFHNSTASDDASLNSTFLEQSYSDTGEDWYYSQELFEHAARVSTLAEKFGLTAFKPFQKHIIDATLDGKDSLVTHPTGSGKGLCFQYPPVYHNKNWIIITPTISLMQDQVHKLTEIGIPSVYLGSAQMDKRLEASALMPESEQLLIFVTPEWVRA